MRVLSFMSILLLYFCPYILTLLAGWVIGVVGWMEVVDGIRGVLSTERCLTVLMYIVHFLRQKCLPIACMTLRSA